MIRFLTDNEILKSRLSELVSDIPAACGLDLDVALSKCGEGVSVECAKGVWSIRYADTSALMRGVTLLVEKANKNDMEKVEEIPTFKTLGVMLDMTEAAVLNLDALKRMVRIIAAEGYNSLVMRVIKGSAVVSGMGFSELCGAYTEEEMRELDAYAASFGIELVPMLQFSEMSGFASAKDFGDVIDGVLREYSENLAAHNVCFGFDRPAIAGCGPYPSMKDNTSAELVSDCVEIISALCEKYGYGVTMGREALDGVSNIPDNVTAVFSECTAVHPNAYREGLSALKQKTAKVGFAGGDNSWYGSIPLSWLSHSAATNTVPALLEQLPEAVYVTMWRDDCEPCSFFSTLPVLFTYGEGCWEKTTYTERLSQRMLTVVGVDFYDMVVLEDIPAIRCRLNTGGIIVNPGKYMLYDGIVDGSFHGHSLGGAVHFVNVAAWTAEKIERSGEFAYVFESAVAYSRFLGEKYMIERLLRKAYSSGNRSAMEGFVATDFDKVLDAVDGVEEKVAHQWKLECKASGFDQVQKRFDLIRERTIASKQLLADYLDGRSEVLPAYANGYVSYIHESGLIHDREAILINDYDAILKGNN